MTGRQYAGCLAVCACAGVATACGLVYAVCWATPRLIDRSKP